MEEIILNLISFTVNAAAFYQEVLIYGDIPQAAIIDFIGGY